MDGEKLLVQPVESHQPAWEGPIRAQEARIVRPVRNQVEFVMEELAASVADGLDTLRSLVLVGSGDVDAHVGLDDADGDSLHRRYRALGMAAWQLVVQQPASRVPLLIHVVERAERKIQEQARALYQGMRQLLEERDEQR